MLNTQAISFLESFSLVSNLACLACLILKLHATCAIKCTLTVTYNTPQETNDLAKTTKTKVGVSFFVVPI